MRTALPPARTGAVDVSGTAVRLGRYSVRLHRRPFIVGTSVLVLLATVAAWSTSTGTFELTPDRLWATLAGNGTVAEHFIVWTVRLPRLATGVCVGACLGIAGAVFQTLSRNPLGSPDILGLTQGASTGALLAIAGTFGTVASVWTVTGYAAVGAFGTGLLIYLLTRGGDPSGYRLVLIGIGTAAILAGVNGYLLTRTTIVDAARAVFWLTGDLSGRDWHQAAVVAAVLLVGGVAVMVIARGLESLRLGEEMATGLGVPVGAVRVVALVCASLLTAGAVSVAGPLAFVALAAPHIAQRLTGTTRNFLSAAMIGALIVTAADAVALIGVGERQLPTGVVTGVVGGVYLMWLLVTNRKKGVMS